jgi:hypothetical protein
MRVSHAALILSAGLMATAVYGQVAPAATQTPTEPQSTPSATTQSANATVPTPATTASSLLQPALTQAQTMLSTLKMDKWKKGSVRDEAGENVNALLHDLQAGMPPLLTAADAEPEALSRAMPLIKHIDAFYDVMLRVEEASRVSAPSDQISALQQTLLDVNKARIAYDDQLQSQAATQEKQVFDLRTDLKTQNDTVTELQAKVAAAAAVPACKPATPARKKKKSTTAKPSAGTPAAPQQ